MAGIQAAAILRHVRGLSAGLAGDVSDRDLLERYATTGEEAAFEAMVRRHGPLVLGVCRRVLGNSHDAEDAFQASFLTLARKASSIRKSESVGSWLYQVAYHTAVRARGQAAARKKVERKAGAGPQADPLTELTGRELVAVLDAEVNALAERYRVPLVLCYFQGLTCDEAARRAGWPVRTFKRRLDQARERLRGRLTRRGLVLPAALSAAGLVQGAEAAVSATLAAATVRAAFRAAASGAAGSVAVDTGSALVGIRLKTVAAALLLGCLVTCGAVALAQQGAPPAPAGAPVRIGKEQARPPEKPGAPAAKRNGVRVAGRVLGADGKPLTGAEVALVGRWLPSAEHPNHDYELLAHTKTDAEGRFTLARKDIAPDRFYHIHALAGARGHGRGWAKLAGGGESAGIELRLEPERVVRGRLVDLQGIPAAGVKGRLAYVAWQEIKLAAGELRNPQVEKQRMLAEKQLRRAMGRGVVPFRRSDGFEFELPKAPQGFAFWPRSFTTDTQGRFEVRGLAAGQDAHLLIEDKRFALQELLVETGGKGPPAEARLSLAPVQRIEGRVVYADSGKPVAGARLNVTAFRDFVGKDSAGRTDSEGRFSINPYPGTSYQIQAWAPAEAPYLSLVQRIEWPRGSVRQTLDFSLPRGVEIRGHVTEAASGKPLAQARVVYRARGDNETAQRAPLLLGPEWPARTAADGSYRLVVPPGPGHLVVDSDDPDLIRQRVSRDEIQTGKPGGRPEFHNHTLAVNPALKDGAKTQDFRLRRGVTVRGTVLGPDGKRVPFGTVLCPGELAPPDGMGGAFVFPGGGESPRGIGFSDGRFELRGCDPARTYRVFVLDVAAGYVGFTPVDGPGRVRMTKMLAGTFLPKAAAAVEISAAKVGAGALTVQLQPSGSARLKLRDAAGKPVRATPAVELEVTPDRGAVLGERATLTAGDTTGGPRMVPDGKEHVTDREGRMTIRGLIPGATYRLRAYDARAMTSVALGEPFTVEAGKTRDLPDAVVPQAPAAP